MSIEQPLFNADDPRLTAYALGELSDPAERAQVEQLLKASPEARAELADIRALTASLTAEYDAERATAAGEETPANVVAMPAARHWTQAPWLKIAALLLVVGLAVGLSLPFLTTGEFKGRTNTALQQQLEQDAKNQAHVTLNSTAPAVASAANAPAPASSQTPSILLAERGDIKNQRSSGALGLEPAPIFTAGGTEVQGIPDANVKHPDFSAVHALRSRVVAAAEPEHLFAAPVPPSPADKPTGSVVLDDINAGRDVTAGFAEIHIPAAPPTASSAATPTFATTTYAGVQRPAPAPANAKRGGVGGSPSASTLAPGLTSQEQAIAQLKDSATGVGPGQGAVGKIRAKAPTPRNGPNNFNFAGAYPVETTPATRVVVTGSNIPTSEDVGATIADASKSKKAAPQDSDGLVNNGSPVPSPAPEGVDKPMAAIGGVVLLNGRLLSDASNDRESNTAQYTHTVENAFLGAKENPLSTFSIDVDTASYAITRRFIESGHLPPPDAVRIEELVNYFPYADAPPAPDNDKPFAIHLEAAACPWDTAHRLVRVGIKGREMDTDKRPPSNLVFLLDVSGSMDSDERLPLIKKSLRLLVNQLREDDRVSIVVYAGASGLALAPTTGDHKDTILRAIESLRPGGSTNGASGIKLAYKMARQGFRKGGTNRVILATDGDFNVGVTNQGDLLRLIEDERKDGVFLSVLGVGTDNLKDSTMQTLADHGNGNYNYIDRLEEGRKVLVNQMSGTLVAIAKDVKIQVEFNPAAVSSYRLIGYEKRMLKKEDFNNDKIDAGEIGAGHSVTALYEVVPTGQPTPGELPAVDALKYGAKPAPTAPPELDDRTAPAKVAVASRELLTVKMRHKAPDSDTSEKSYEVALVDDGAPGAYSNASPDFQFSAAVASFGMLLRDSPYKGESSFGGVLELAQAGKGEDPNGYRKGFIELVREARNIQRGDR